LPVYSRSLGKIVEHAARTHVAVGLGQVPRTDFISAWWITDASRHADHDASPAVSAQRNQGYPRFNAQVLDDYSRWMQFFPLTHTGEIVLWETTNGVRCSRVRRESGVPIEITVAHGDKILCRMSFQLSEDATTFAIAAMYEGDNLRRLRPMGLRPIALALAKN
jgi:hypothetical protein